MVEDSVLVALINVSVTAPEREKRVAAKILIEVLRSTSNVNDTYMAGESVAAPNVKQVADELRRLIDLHGLRNNENADFMDSGQSSGRF